MSETKAGYSEIMPDSKKEFSAKVESLVSAKIKEIGKIIISITVAVSTVFTIQYVFFRDMIKDNITPVQQGQIHLREDFKEFKGEFTEFKGEFTEFKGEFTELKGEFTEFKTEIKTDLKNLETKIDKLVK